PVRFGVFRLALLAAVSHAPRDRSPRARIRPDGLAWSVATLARVASRWGPLGHGGRLRISTAEAARAGAHAPRGVSQKARSQTNAGGARGRHPLLARQAQASRHPAEARNEGSGHASRSPLSHQKVLHRRNAEGRLIDLRLGDALAPDG